MLNGQQSSFLGRSGEGYSDLIMQDKGRLAINHYLATFHLT